jgi:hypothetical protein
MALAFLREGPSEPSKDGHYEETRCVATVESKSIAD